MIAGGDALGYLGRSSAAFDVILLDLLDGYDEAGLNLYQRSFPSPRTPFAAGSWVVWGTSRDPICLRGGYVGNSCATSRTSFVTEPRSNRSRAHMLSSWPPIRSTSSELRVNP
ncbi:MAG TPA: hypothetical protein VLK65_12420 [Vicinamibacteria bacterium]|nr:hypothetical protein [Vicinamibacteria bacterium]